ncbi:MAG: hypothetical protein ACREQ5_01655 [Candidatus Dormibacteria bacterium]
MVDIGGIISKLIGPESMARQFFMWNVASAVANTALGPYLEALRQDVNQDHPLTLISPPDLADMVVRGILPQDKAAAIAKKNGFTADDFNLLVLDTGEPPSALDLVTLFRRGELPHDDVVKGIKQGRTRNEWIDTLFKLGMVVPSPIDIVDALVKGQISDTDARAAFAKLGGDMSWFDLLFNTAGEGPSPLDAATMARKGIIPWTGSGPGVTSYEQAFKESHFRDKWIPAVRANSQYIPPPRTVTALHNSGAIDTAMASKLFADAGLAPDLISAYLVDSTKTKTVKAKELTESEIGILYQDQAIGVDDAVSFLALIGYNKSEADFIIGAWNLVRIRKYTEAAIGVIRSSYTAHKIDVNQASVFLDKLGIQSGQRDQLIQLWTYERQSKVALLTPTQIRQAYTKSLIDEEGALSRLEAHGYSPDDAALFLAL